MINGTRTPSSKFVYLCHELCCSADRQQYISKQRDETTNILPSCADIPLTSYAGQCNSNSNSNSTAHEISPSTRKKSNNTTQERSPSARKKKTCLSELPPMVSVQQDDRGFCQPKFVKLVQDSANLKARGLCFGFVWFDVVIAQPCQHASSTVSCSREE